MLNPFQVPVLKNREWRFLSREFVGAHPALRSAKASHLQLALSPVASVAWWIATFRPELLEQDRLHVLLPGASVVECTDTGRWFSHLPWMLGRPAMQTTVTLVGDELARGSTSSKGMSRQQLERAWESPLAPQTTARPPADVFNGTLAEWRKSESDRQSPDVCILFSPGFESHWERWLTESDLLAVLRAGTAMGAFSYSRMDGTSDMHLLHLWGLLPQPKEQSRNPWGLAHELSDRIGSYAQFGWEWVAPSVPPVLSIDPQAVNELLQAQHYIKEDYHELQDEAVERLGSRWEVMPPGGGKMDAIVVLPHNHGVLESTGAAGEFDEKGFVPFDPPLLVPPEVLAGRPEPFLLRQMLWSVKVHQQFVAPQLVDREDDDEDEGDDSDEPLFPGLAGMSAEDLNEKMGDMLRGVLGKDVNTKTFMRDMRAQGGVHGPTHPCWYDLLASLGWDPQGYVEKARRLQPAFSVGGRRHAITLPVICEAYEFFPDDAGDDLAAEAMAAVAAAHPGGALLTFKLMPFTEVEGRKYSFGGMLWWKGRWHAFALNSKMNSVDAVIDQVEAGFTFTKPIPAYADECQVAMPFSRMCLGLDPNEHTKTKMMGLRSGIWTTLLPWDQP